MSILVRRLSPDWDMTFGQGLGNFARDAEAVGQDVKTRLQLLQEEWFLDLDAGIPYLQDIAVKPSNVTLAESIIKQCILDTAGVDEITEFAVTYDRDSRVFGVTATLRTIYDNFSEIKVSLA